QTAKALNAVVAARSAHQQRDYPLRDHLLTSAKEQLSADKLLILISEVELFLDEGRHNDALAALQSIYASGGLQSTAVLLLELKAQRMAENWDAVLELTDILTNRSSVDRSIVDEL